MPEENTTARLYGFFRKHPSVCTDSRRIETGALFFALHGDNFDGNDFAAAALDTGAAIAVVDNPAVAEKGDERYFLVGNTLEALQDLARYHRSLLGIPILGITGSNGKTTTKELLSRTLSRKFRISVTQGNLNNHIGVPLTLLSMTRETEFGIVEMGANHCGEIASLCAIARPDYGLITNIGRAHLEGFGGPQGVVRGKGELFDYLNEHGGTAFYLSDSDTLTSMIAERPELKNIPYSTAGLLSETGEDGFLRVRRQDTTIQTRLVGDYNAYNVAAAIAVGDFFGISADEAAEAISGYIPDNNRSQKRPTRHNMLILDAYNANPSSMKAALENFGKESSPFPKTVILGDMRELGQYAETEHRSVIAQLVAGGIREAYLVGPVFHALAASGEIPQPNGFRFTAFPDTDALNGYLSDHPLRERFILIKGSRGIRLEKTVPLL